MKAFRGDGAVLGVLLVLCGMVWCACGAAAGATNHVTVFGGDRPLHWPLDLDRSLGPGFLAVLLGFAIVIVLFANESSLKDPPRWRLPRR